MENDLIQNAAKDSNKMLNRKMKILLDIGQTLMENGADCSRIVRDMRRAAVHLRIPAEQIQSHVTYTTLMLCVSDGERSFTQFRKFMKHGVNLAVLAAVSKLTWRILRGNTPLNPIERAINRIASVHSAIPTGSSHLAPPSARAARASSSAAAGSRHSSPPSRRSWALSRIARARDTRSIHMRAP